MIKLNLGCGKYPLEGFINLDSRSDLEHIFLDKHLKGENPKYDIKQWKWQDGLKDFNDYSVEAITESHSLMYLTINEYVPALSECYRVLTIEGVLRITEDNCETPNYTDYGLPWGNPASLTGPKITRQKLEEIKGFKVFDVLPDETYYKDKTLIQQFHGDPPRVFHIEAIKIF